MRALRKSRRDTKGRFNEEDGMMITDVKERKGKVRQGRKDDEHI